MKKLTTILMLLMLVCVGAWAEEITLSAGVKNNGTMTHTNGNVNTGLGYIYVSGTTPDVTIQATNTEGANYDVMNRGNGFFIANGTSNFEISLPDGYVIESFTFNIKNNQAANTVTFTSSSGTVSQETVPSNAATDITVSEINAQSASFTLTTTSGGWNPCTVNSIKIVYSQTSSDYSSSVEANIKPWAETAGQGLFTLDPEDSAVASLLKTYNDGPANGQTWTKDEYEAMAAALQKAKSAEAYLFPETGYYHIKSKAYGKYIGYGVSSTSGKGDGLIQFADAGETTNLLLTKSGNNEYTISYNGQYVQKVTTTNKIFPLGDSGDTFQFVVVEPGVFTLYSELFNTDRGYFHAAGDWDGVVAWTLSPDASHWTIEEASGPVNPPVVDPVNTSLALAIDVLNDVPYALFPSDFDWDAARAYKYYKNSVGRYQLASRLAVAVLTRLVDFATAEDDVKQQIAKDLEEKYGIANFEDQIDDLLTNYARKVVETHGEAYALYEQGDENFSRMYDALTQAGVTDTEQYAAFLAAGSSSATDPYEESGIERTLSDAYELLVKKLKDPKPFDADLTAHIVNPNFENGTDGWTVTGWGTGNGKPLTDSEGETRPYNNYLNAWNKPNETIDAYQELTLPAGRYMLTMAGRGSETGLQQVSAADPEKFLQVYATNNQGVTRAQSVYPIVGETKDGGVFGNGWNDASVFFTMPSAGKAVIGVRAGMTDKRWASATRFRLTRVGDPTLFFDEYQTYDDKLHYDPIFEQLNQLAPVDIVLHKVMEPGKWYAMSLPANITKEQLAEKFGTGTRLAQLWGAEKTDEGAVAYFSSLPIATTNYFPTCPFLIKPEKVSANHMYVFHDVVGRHDYVSSGVNYGEQGAASTEWGKGGTAKCGPGGGRDMRFVSNYTYDTAFDKGYNLEMSDTLKSFSAYLEAGDVEIVSVLVDGTEVILDQQLAQAARNGAVMAARYAGIPEAMTNALKVTSTANKVATLKAYRQASGEAKKAVAPSKEFNAAVAEAEDLLASEHTELVAGADAAFKALLTEIVAAFNQTTLAADIPAQTEKLREEIEKFKTQIDQGLVELESGMHLFYNIGSKKYLGGGNNWGTQASLTKHGELMEISKLEDGKYTIETRFTNGNNWHGFATNSAGVYYVDGAATGASLEIVAVEPYVYTISDNKGYLGYNGENTVLATGLTDANDANARWIILSEEELLKRMAEDASVKNPMDVTFLIKNPDFSRGHRDVAAWTFTVDTSNGGSGRLNASSASASADMFNYSAEAWKASFELSQELTVPNGVYVMEVQGAVTDYTEAYDGTDYPVFFANGETAPFLSMEEEHRAKSMLDLQKAFYADKYFVEPMVVEVTDGQLTVGAKGTRSDLWATWDNFSLTFYGNVNIDDVKQLYGKTTGNETNGINTIDNGQLTNDGWYSIDGRKLNVKPTQKGIYIVNGKKVIVK